MLVATLWLAWSNQLVLYIHPRYIVFTVAMSVIALALIVASIVTKRPEGHEPAHEHEHEHDSNPANFPPRATTAIARTPSRPRRRPARALASDRIPALLALGGFALSAVFALTLVVVPPATLTSATADQRDMNSTGVGADVQSVDDAALATDSAVSQFTVLDWASLLSQTSDARFYGGKTADVVGFITADTEDPENLFYVSRFIVTCCAVDAQPVGVPVYLPQWEDSFAADQWVRVTGEFSVNPSRLSTQAVALSDARVTVTEVPDEPYLF